MNGETATKRIEVPATGHKYVDLEAKEATCVNGIKEGYAVCETCGHHFTVSKTGEEVKYEAVENEDSKEWEIPALAEGGHNFSESPVITIDENGKDPKFSEQFSATAKETCLDCGKSFDIDWARITVDKNVSGSCGTEGASVTYTVTATGSKGLKATKTVTFDLSAAEHVEKYVYNTTGHAKSCEVCGTNLNANPNVEFENHKIEISCIGDIREENGRIVSKHQKICTDCGYTVEEYCTMVPSLNGFKVNEGEHICNVCHRTQSHDSYEWTKKAEGYKSKCSACGKVAEKIGTWKEILDSIPAWAHNEGYITVAFDGANCSLNGNMPNEKVVPEGLKLVFKPNTTLTVSNNVTVKGVIEIQEGATCTVNEGGSLTVDKKVNGAEVRGEVTGSLVEEVNTQEAFEKALEEVKEIVVSGDVELNEDLPTTVTEVNVKEGTTLKVTSENEKFASSTHKGNEPTINLEEGSTLLVEGRLGRYVKIEGDGKVELNSSYASWGNGYSLESAAADGAKNVQLDSETEIYSRLNVEKELNITAKEGVKITTDGKTNNIYVKKDGQLTIDGVDIEQTDTTGDSTDLLIKVDEGKLTLKNNTVSVASGYGIALFGDSTKPELKIEGSKILCQKSPCIGTNNADTKDSMIEVSNSTLEVKEKGIPAVFLPAKGEATFKDCTITGGTAIEAVGLTTLNLKGETKLNATAKNYVAPKQETGPQASGAALLIVSHKGYNQGGTMTVNIDATVTATKKAKDAELYEVYEHTSGAGIAKVEFKHKADSFSFKDGTTSSCDASTQKV